MSEVTPEVYEHTLAQAIRLQEAGELNKAKQCYEQLLKRHPDKIELQHNLGATLLHLGFLHSGEAMLNQAYSRDPDHAGMRDTPAMIAKLLYSHGYWEAARPWFLEAQQKAPDDVEIAMTLSRIYPRDYLEPEVFDPLAKQTLLRASPRESEHYVYTIDIAGTCNLRCPSCPVGNSDDPARSASLMSADMFNKILAKIARETPDKQAQIWLYNWGEPLLHPKLPVFISAIREAGFSSHLSSNLNIEKGLKELIKAQPDSLKISLSGFSQSTYQQTHAKGDLHLVKSNMYKLRSFIDQYKASTRVWVGHHIYKHNFHQKDEVQRLCEELQFQYAPIQAFYQPLEKLMGIAKNETEILEEPILSNLLIHPKDQIAFSKQHQQAQYDCELRFNQTVINADGSVAQCCSQYQSENILGLSFLDHPREEIESAKYQNKLCGECRSLGLDYAPKKLPSSLSPSSSA